MPLTNLNFHHIGYACKDLDREQQALSLLGYVQESDDFDDPLQHIKGRFLTGPGPRIELLVQYEGTTVLEPWLMKGVKMYHLAYEVPELEKHISLLQEAGGKITVPAAPAVAFAGREICFIMLPSMQLVELIQS